ncbi:uncharacterized protein LOC117340240 [Pecten maximus]|uniref:uncharacterized protein LOC117340240 n=1 Tax=Pecten maximus TaxID=6579 RepID=UPI001458C2B3|nr:uncharacterized protein LOC117340240 [Pecten maximus]
MGIRVRPAETLIGYRAKQNNPLQYSTTSVALGMATPSAPEMVSCPSHPGEEIIFVCSGCGDVFACSKCVTSVHRGHVLNCVHETAKSLSGPISALVRTRITDAETVARRLEDIKVDYDQTTDNLKNLLVEVKLRRTKLKAVVDDIADNALLAIQDLIQDNEAIIADYKSKLHELGNQLYSITRDRTESVVNGGSSTEIISHFRDLSIPPLFPRCPSFRRGNFTSAELVEKDIGQMFGKFAVNEIKRKESSLDPPPRPPRTTQPETNSQLLPVTPPAELISARETIPERRVLRNSSKKNKSEQQAPKPIKSERRSSQAGDDFQLDLKKLGHIQEESSLGVRAFWYNNRKFLISYKADRRLVFVNETGEKNRKIKVMSNIMDACISPLTGNAWICCEDQTITEIGSKTNTVRFATESLPLCICAQKKGAFLIGVKNEIMQYNVDGNILHRTSCLDGFASVVYPWVIRENQITGEVALSYGYQKENSSKVTLFDRDLKLIFQFPGHKHAQDDFIPDHICFTPNGQLLVLDMAANKLVLVGRQGVTLKETALHQFYPSGMTIGPRNQLCLVQQTLTSQIMSMDLLQTGQNEYTYALF